jgi:hypothetical protein
MLTINHVNLISDYRPISHSVSHLQIPLCVHTVYLSVSYDLRMIENSISPNSINRSVLTMETVFPCEVGTEFIRDLSEFFRLCATSRKVVGAISDWVIEISLRAAL